MRMGVEGAFTVQVADNGCGVRAIPTILLLEVRHHGIGGDQFCLGTARAVVIEIIVDVPSATLHGLPGVTKLVTDPTRADASFVGEASGKDVGGFLGLRDFIAALHPVSYRITA